MGLIDTDKLIEDIHKRSYISKGLSEIFETVIDEQPTAFDVDKVVEQLKERSTLSRPVGWSKSYEIVPLKEVIEIVKGESEE